MRIEERRTRDTRLLALVLTASVVWLAQAVAQTPVDEAGRHYRIGLVALENNDLLTALDALRASVRLAPENALAHYKLAVVCARRGLPSEAAAAPARARELGLPEKEKADAEGLDARLAYPGRPRPQREEAALATLKDFLAPGCVYGAGRSYSALRLDAGGELELRDETVFQTTEPLTFVSRTRMDQIDVELAPNPRLQLFTGELSVSCDSMKFRCRNGSDCIELTIEGSQLKASMASLAVPPLGTGGERQRV